MFIILYFLFYLIRVSFPMGVIGGHLKLPFYLTRVPLRNEHCRLSFYIMRVPLRNEVGKCLVSKAPFFLAGN